MSTGSEEEREERATLIAAARRLGETGLNRGASGNVSLRRGDGGGLWITASGVPADRLDDSHAVALDWDGTWRAEPGLKPSSEWRFHRDILSARPEHGAVVHAHPVHATALAVHGRAIPPFHYLVALGGGRDIRCAGYATFGTQALSDLVLEALEGRTACLMAHHGMIACGPTANAALVLAVEVERLAAQYIAASTLGVPPLLSDDEIEAVLARIAAGPGYGTAPGEAEEGAR